MSGRGSDFCGEKVSGGREARGRLSRRTTGKACFTGILALLIARDSQKYTGKYILVRRRGEEMAIVVGCRNCGR